MSQHHYTPGAILKALTVSTIEAMHLVCCVLLFSLFCFDCLTGNWEIPFELISDLQWLGSGAQGAVFLGRLNDEQVAVKKVRNASETDIVHLRKLCHPNIIKFKLVNFGIIIIIIIIIVKFLVHVSQ